MSDTFGRFLRRRWVRWLAALVGIALTAMLVMWLIFARGLPSAESLLEYEPALPTNVRAIDGAPVQTFARERRVELDYGEYSPVVIRAFLAAEDKTFFEHGGLDYPGLFGAIVDYVSKMGTDERARGGSTITQQVAKNLLLSDEYSIDRKIREAILSRRIEAALSKQQILELYLNQIFLGRNAYGVQAAARAYFEKDATDLDLHEAAFLAALPRAPANYSPDRFPERALARRNWVLGQMRENEWITPAQFAIARARPLASKRRDEIVQRGNVNGYFMEEVRRLLLDRFGENAEAGPHSVYSGGLWVRTSFDAAMQETATKSLRAGLLRYDAGRPWNGPVATLPIEEDEWDALLRSSNLSIDYEDWRVAVVLAKEGGEATIGFSDGSTSSVPSYAASIARRGGGTAYSTMQPGDVITVRPQGGAYGLAKVPEISGGMVVEDVDTGRVFAMQGGFSSGLEAFNRATQAQRQPGSAVKPFVYAAAMQNGMTPASIIVDASFCVYQSASLGSKCFRNSGGGAAGPQTLRWGLEQSRNLMTVRAASTTGMDKVVEVMRKARIGDYDPYLAFALGAGDTTVLRLTNAFGMLANHGRDVGPSLIDYVQDRHGDVIYPEGWEACEGCNMAEWDGSHMPRPPIGGRQVIDPMVAYQMVHVLEGVVLRGTARNLRALERPIFGKTGTNTGPTNVWWVGGTPETVIGVYLGFDRQRSMGGYAQGGTLAAPIFRQFVQEALADEPVTPFGAPLGTRMVRIDRRSGRRVYGGWPDQSGEGGIIWEAFSPESEPTRTISRDEMANRRPEPRIRREPVRSNGPTAPSNDTEFLQSEGGIY